MTDSTVLATTDVDLDVCEGIATITLNRPDQLNAFNDRMVAELLAALDAVDADDSVRAVILTGAGKAFCAGADIGEDPAPFVAWRRSPDALPDDLVAVPGSDLPIRRDGGGRMALRIFACNKPVIAAINGHAVGVGATLTLACDIRLASEDARFGFVFGRLGTVVESCSSWFLPRVVPMQVAMEWVLTARVFPAAEALEGGLVRRIYPAEALLPAARRLAEEIAATSAPVATALSRQLLLRMQTARHPLEAHYAETLAFNERAVSADVQEGVTAFLGRRSADFPDRVSDGLPAVFKHLESPRFDPSVLVAGEASGPTDAGCADRFAVQDVITLYATVMDTRDWPRLAEVFAEDVHTTYGGQSVDGLGAVTTHIASHLDGCGPSQHLLGNHRIVITGDEATAVTSVRVIHLGAGERSSLSPYDSIGEYHDRLRRTDAGWRIVERRLDVRINRGDRGVLGPA